MKRTTTTACTALMAALLMFGSAGCGSEAASPDAGAGDSKEPVTLKFIWWGSAQRKEITLKVIEQYQQAHPDVKFVTEDYPNASVVATKLAMETAKREAPDIIQGDYSFIFNYIQRDLIEPLDPYVRDKVLDLSDIDPSYLQPGQSEGKQYAIPMGTNALALAYDPALFEKAGIAPLTNGYTVDDLYTAMKQLRDKIKTPGFYPLDNMLDLSYWLRTKGETLYAKDGNGLGYKDESLVDYFKLVRKWTEEKLLNPNVDVSPVSIGANNPLAAGKTALFPMTSNQIIALGKQAARPVAMLALPTFSGEKEGSYVKPSQFLAASSYSKHKKEAVDFINYFINSTEANDVLNGERGVPIPAKVAARLMEKADDLAKQQYTHMAYISQHSTPIDPPAPKVSGVVSNLLQLTLNNLIAGNMTPEESAAKFRSDVEPLFQQGGASK